MVAGLEIGFGGGGGGCAAATAWRGAVAGGLCWLGAGLLCTDRLTTAGCSRSAREGGLLMPSAVTAGGAGAGGGTGLRVMVS